MLQEPGAHENQSNINNTSNNNTPNTNDILRPWESTPREKALLAGELLTVECRRQRPDRGQRRGLSPPDTTPRTCLSRPPLWRRRSGGTLLSAAPWPPSDDAELRPPMSPWFRPLQQRLRDAPGDPELSETGGDSPSAPHPSAPSGGRPRPRPPPCPRRSGQEGRRRAVGPVRVPRPRRGESTRGI